MARAVLILSVLLVGRSALAYRAGIETTACTSGCHNGGNTPTVTIELDPAEPSAGDLVTFTVRVTDANNGVGGVYVTADVTVDGSDYGRFFITDSANTRIGSDTSSFTHAQPVDALGGYITFEANWQVPGEEGSVLFTATALAANGNNNTSGDGSDTATLPLTFGCEGKTYYRDFDGDGYGGKTSPKYTFCSLQPGYSETNDDCNENDDRIHPGKPELCNLRDDDCNGVVDDGLEDEMLYPDEDNDGYGTTGTPVKGCPSSALYGTGTDDCDDNDPSTYPGAVEICDQADNDCDGEIDEGARPHCGIGRCESVSTSCSTSDCRPGSASTETCNGLDDDCDGVVDDAAVCPSSGICSEGACAGGASAIEDSDDTTDGNADAGTSSNEVSGCAAAPFGVFAALVFVAAVRRRYASANKR